MEEGKVVLTVRSSSGEALKKSIEEEMKLKDAIKSILEGKKSREKNDK